MTDNKWDEIETLDLTTVKEKLKGRKGWWWNLRRDVDKIEKEYKQFLYLIAANPGRTVVPWSEDVDDLWHEHILDTQKYEADCDRLFGKYLHHNPHLAVGSAPQMKAFVETKEMYREAFGPKVVDRKEYGSGGGDGLPGCGTVMPVVFCGAACGATHSTHSDGGGASCGSSCGGGGCGGN